MNDWILVEDGDVFEGDWSMLDDCFGLRDEDELEDWCNSNGWVYTITDRKTLH